MQCNGITPDQDFLRASKLSSANKQPVNSYDIKGVDV
jgi:hypothetical protein